MDDSKLNEAALYAAAVAALNARRAANGLAATTLDKMLTPDRDVWIEDARVAIVTYEATLAASREHAEPVAAEAGWQDISTAPKDGTRIIVLTSDRTVADALWDPKVENFYKSQKGWASYDPENAKGDWITWWLGPGDCRMFCGQTPTHWMPLPAPPALAAAPTEADAP